MPFDNLGFTETKPDAVLDTLRRVRELYTPATAYVRNNYGWDGKPACATGLIMRSAVAAEALQYTKQAAEELFGPNKCLTVVNDGNGHDAALRVLDRAIALRDSQ